MPAAPPPPAPGEPLLLAGTPGPSRIDVTELGKAGRALSVEISTALQEIPELQQLGVVSLKEHKEALHPAWILPLTLGSVLLHIRTTIQTQETKARTQVKMGFIFSKSMNENMKNQQEFMLMNARLQVVMLYRQWPLWRLAVIFSSSPWDSILFLIDHLEDVRESLKILQNFSLVDGILPCFPDTIMDIFFLKNLMGSLGGSVV
ncbi:uncharacterized protein LOC121484515 isoform X4 [Vulpes lagopus]|uniref:uncharacterized protein LOC121484515 isoform X4 n=1 Tax=Vulpes lagopus TaxID=494514 RepID=UPI001BC9DB2E|nr:uncharacterized protein LOC121484515 isoform X4 [Vulpes lagopus]